MRMSLWLALRARVEQAAEQLDAAADQLFTELDHLDMVERLGHQMFGGTHNPDMAAVLWTIPQARAAARDAYLEYMHAARRCREYLAAVDPDRAGGSVRGLPEPVECGPARGGWQEHGGPDVEPARQPVTDVSRGRTAVYTELGADGLVELTNLDDGIVALRAEMLAAAGHAMRRHGPSVTVAQLEARATRGRDPITGTRTDWETGNQHGSSRHATAFTSREALVFAEAVAWNSPQRAAACAQADTLPIDDEERNHASVSLPARQVFGDDFRRHVHGRTRLGSIKNPQGSQPTVFADSATVTVLYRRERGGAWLPYTCYVNPEDPR